MQARSFLWETSLFFFSLIIRLPSLGWDIFNPDSWRWKARSYQFSTGLFGLDFTKTAQTAHPGVSLMWLSAFAIKAYNLFNRLFRPTVEIGSREEVFAFHFAMKLTVVLTISLLLALSFFLLRKLVDFWSALFSILILTFEPFFLAQTRVYHLDALLAMLMFVSILALLNGLSGKTRPFPAFALRATAGRLQDGSFLSWLLLSAVLTSLTLLTKSTGLFLIPLAGLILLLGKTRPFGRDENAPSQGPSFPRAFAGYLLLVACFFFLLWPAMWVQPLKTLALYFSGIFGEGFGEHGQVFFGQVRTNPGPLFYPLSLWIRLSPWMLGLAVLGIGSSTGCASPWKLRKKNPTAFFSFLFIFLYLIFITIPSKKLERYTLPVYPFLAVLAGFGLSRLREFLERFLAERSTPSPPKKQAGSRTGLFLASLLFVLFLSSACQIHPDYLAYYSPLAGGLRGGIRVIRPDWVIGAARVGEYFNDLPQADRIRILAPDPDQFRPFLKGQIRDILGVSRPGGFDYILLPVWENPEKYGDYNLKPEGTVRIRSVAIYNIYQIGKQRTL